MIDKSRDDEIIIVMKSILDHSHFEVETPNESVLVELMKRRNTPIVVDKSYRNTSADFEMWEKEQEYKKPSNPG